MLRRDGGHVASEETAGFVQALTEIGLKIKLLGEYGNLLEHCGWLTAACRDRSVWRESRDSQRPISWAASDKHGLLLLRALLLGGVSMLRAYLPVFGCPGAACNWAGYTQHVYCYCSNTQVLVPRFVDPCGDALKRRLEL